MRTGKRTRAALSSWQEKLEFGVAEKTVAEGTVNHEICRGQADWRPSGPRWWQMTTQVLLLYKMFRTFYLQQCLPLLQQGQMPHSFPRTFLTHFLKSIRRILDLLFKTPSLNVSYLMHFSVLLYCNKEDWNGHRIIGFMPPSFTSIMWCSTLWAALLTSLKLVRALHYPVFEQACMKHYFLHYNGWS